MTTEEIRKLAETHAESTTNPATSLAAAQVLVSLAQWRELERIADALREISQYSGETGAG